VIFVYEYEGKIRKGEKEREREKDRGREIFVTIRDISVLLSLNFLFVVNM
jgi:hypothetical protein